MPIFKLLCSFRVIELALIHQIEEQLRTLELSSLQERRLGATSLLSTVFWGGEVEREVLSSAHWDPVI